MPKTLPPLPTYYESVLSMQKVWLSLTLVWVSGCTAPVLKAVGLAPGHYCYAQSSNPLPYEAIVRLTLTRQGTVTGEGRGYISKESDSYHAQYQQTFNGQLVDQYLQLKVTTTLNANRDDMTGHPPHSKEQWLISASQLTPKIVHAPLQRVDCEQGDSLRNNP